MSSEVANWCGELIEANELRGGELVWRAEASELRGGNQKASELKASELRADERERWRTTLNYIWIRFENQEAGGVFRPLCL